MTTEPTWRAGETVGLDRLKPVGVGCRHDSECFENSSARGGRGGDYDYGYEYYECCEWLEDKCAVGDAGAVGLDNEPVEDLFVRASESESEMKRRANVAFAGYLDVEMITEKRCQRLRSRR